MERATRVNADGGHGARQAFQLGKALLPPLPTLQRWTRRMTEEAQGGRIFFSSTGRSLVDEDEIVVLSVGVDIGSSTSHLVFSRIVLERLDSRYVVTTRETF